MVKVGIIGGSGLDNPEFFSAAEELAFDTPYGMPSSTLKCGTIESVPVVLLARHGREHTITPTNVNFRANIDALKRAGCTHLLTTSACGSLREEIRRGDLVILDQFIDFTRRRALTFYDEFEPHNAKHTSMAEPFDPHLRDVLLQTGTDLGLRLHKTGTVITIEGPRFSTIAESRMFRLWGADVINMSIAPECILANEAGLPYAAIAMSTDYDCWKADETPVTWDEILQIFSENVEKVVRLLSAAVKKI